MLSRLCMHKFMHVVLQGPSDYMEDLQNRESNRYTSGTLPSLDLQKRFCHFQNQNLEHPVAISWEVILLG